MSGDGLPATEATLALPVEHRGEPLGALTLTKPPGDRLTPAEEHLARDLASGAGLVLLMTPFMGGMMRKRNAGFLANLKRVLEGDR